jgi:hypothetical protein
MIVPTRRATRTWREASFRIFQTDEADLWNLC